MIPLPFLYFYFCLHSNTDRGYFVKLLHKRLCHAFKIVHFLSFVSESDTCHYALATDFLL